MSGWIVKFNGPCTKCGTVLRAGSPAIWNRSTRSMSCIECPIEADVPSPPLDAGVAGSSARREYERRMAKRELADKERWGERIGGWVNRFGPVPQSTAAWGLGARGEELLANALEALPGLIVLHDRRVPRTRGNIDHIVVAPAGVFVVDAKFVDGTVEVRDHGGLFRTDLRLTVGRRNKSHLAANMGWQVDAVVAALAEAAVDPMPPITPVLCFVDSRWPLLRPPRVFQGVLLESERSIVSRFTASTALDRAAMDRIALVLASAFPPK